MAGQQQEVGDAEADELPQQPEQEGAAAAGQDRLRRGGGQGAQARAEAADQNGALGDGCLHRVAASSDFGSGFATGQHLLDATAVHFQHLEPPAAEHDAIAGPRHPAEQRQQQTGQGVVAAFGRQVGQSQSSFQFVDRGHAVEGHGGFAFRSGHAFLVFGTGGFADDRLQHVGRGHHAFEAAVFVHHQRQAQGIGFQPLQGVERADRVGDDHGLAQAGAERQFAAAEDAVQQVLGLHDPDHVVDRAVADDEARVRRGLQRGGDGLGGMACGRPRRVRCAAS